MNWKYCCCFLTHSVLAVTVSLVASTTVSATDDHHDHLVLSEVGTCHSYHVTLHLVCENYNTDDCLYFCVWTVAFKIYDIDRDGYISNGELFHVLKMMVGANLKDAQLQQIVDKTIINADTDGDGKISFEEFCMVRIILFVSVSGQPTYS